MRKKKKKKLRAEEKKLISFAGLLYAVTFSGSNEDKTLPLLCGRS